MKVFKKKKKPWGRGIHTLHLVVESGLELPSLQPLLMKELNHVENEGNKWTIEDSINLRFEKMVETKRVEEWGRIGEWNSYLKNEGYERDRKYPELFE